ncbi:MAG: 50S ribosome-binding GTPase [Candidatus Lokiarchaeota archaeon]|nr:50S ribosome-binding GTPase [Candidatus Lokiarchaeota archaeon]
MPFKTVKAWEIIWNNVRKAELVLEVIDARNPQGTRSPEIEAFVRKQENRRLAIVLNKIDLAPRHIVQEWEALLAKESPTICISARHPSNVSEFIAFMKDILRDLPAWSEPDLHCSVLVVGYPNSGKSTLIQSLTRNRKKLGTSSQAGFTKVIQKIKLDEKIYLFDSPGVIPIAEYEAETRQALDTGSIAPQMVADKETVCEEIVRRVGLQGLNEIYGTTAADKDEFVEQLGKARGFIARGAVVRENDVFELLIRDWQRNHISYYYAPDPDDPKSRGIPHAAERKRR